MRVELPCFIACVLFDVPLYNFSLIWRYLNTPYNKNDIGWYVLLFYISNNNQITLKIAQHGCRTRAIMLACPQIKTRLFKKTSSYMHIDVYIIICN